MIMALDVKISYSWTDYCRLCLLDSGIMLPLFEEGDGLNRNLADKIEACLQIVTYDGDPLPRRICHKCLFKLNQMYEFRSMALASLDRLKVHLLPLKHVPAVEQYLDKANLFPRTEAEDEILTTQVSPSGNGTISNKDSQLLTTSKGSKPTIRVKGEKELSASLLHYDTPSQSHSPPDSTSVASITDKVSMDDLGMFPKTGRPRRALRGNTSLNDRNLLNGSSTNLLSHESSLTKPPQLSGNHETRSTSLTQRRKLTSTDDSDNEHSDHSNGSISQPGPLSMKRKRKLSLQSVSHSTQWNCVMCDSYFLSKKALLSHMEICLTCSTCSQEFGSLPEKAQHEADSHLRVFLDSGRNHMRKCCSICPARFVSNVMLSMHVKYDHQSIPTSSKMPGKTTSFKNGVSKSVFSKKKNAISKLKASELLHGEPKTSHINQVKGKLNNRSESCSSDSDSSSKAHMPKVALPKRRGSEMKRCSKCPRNFITVENRDDHEANHHLMRFNCSVCGSAYRNAGAVRDHMRKAHRKHPAVPFTCKYCKETFESRGVLYLHKKLHMKDAKKDRKPAYLKKNLEPETAKSFTCIKCNEKFTDDNDLMLHLYDHAVKPLEVNESMTNKEGKMGPKTSKLELSQTLLSNDSSKKGSLICEFCNIACPSEEFYKKHILKHSKKSKSLFPCSGCKLIFRNMEALTRHTCAGDQGDERNTCCLDCGQALMDGEVHECDNRCPQCKKVFRSARGQRLHSFYKHGKGILSDSEINEYQDPPLSEASVSTLADDVDHSLMEVPNKVELCDDLPDGSTPFTVADLAPSAVRVHEDVELPQDTPILEELLTSSTAPINPFSGFNISTPDFHVNKSNSSSPIKLWHSPVSRSEDSNDAITQEERTTGQELCIN